MQIKQYSQDGLTIIEQSNFLKKEDFQAIQEMQIELQDTFEKKQIWRTDTEMRISVLNDIKFPTRASKYWQSVREQAVFFENLVILSFDYRRNDVKIRQLCKEIKKQRNTEKKEFLQIDLEEAYFNKKNMEIAAKNRVRELKLWSKIKKDLDDKSFDTKNVNTHQLISYTKRFLQQKMSARDSGSPAERQNLEGQLVTSLKYCKKMGVLDDVLKGSDDETKKILHSLLN